MDLQLKEKVIIVTGGASGIGEGIVKACVQEGAIPIVVNRNTDRGVELTENLKAAGHKCLFVLADLSELQQCQHVVEETVKAFGQIDVLVNNAGGNDNLSLEDTPPAEFMTAVQNHLLHYYALAHYALPYLKQSKGNIVNISSKTAVTGQGGTSAYVAAKGAQLSLTREWAAELLPYGIRVNAVLPAEVLTPMYEKWLQRFDDVEKKLAEIKQRIPLGKRMTTI